MGFEVRAGVSFCETSGRLVFLDVVEDRYFCIPREAERSFARLVQSGTVHTADKAIIEGLASIGLIVAAPGDARPIPCRPAAIPRSSLLDVARQTGSLAVTHSLVRLTLSTLSLKLMPLNLILGRLKKRKAKLEPRPQEKAGAIADVAAAFRRSALIASPLDRCLPRSIAAAHALLDRGARPDLVIGVRLNPFGAHCWVQCGERLVNESLDEVRNFTPILVV